MSSATAASGLVEDLDRLRSDTRGARHAYWFALLVFGILTMASAPLYLATTRVAGLSSYSTESTIALPQFLQGAFGGVPAVALYWVPALALGVTVTALWYAWFRTVAGLETRVRIPVWVWTIAVLAVITLPLLDPSSRWLVQSRGTIALLVIAAGLIALAVVERSGFFASVVVVFTASAVLGVSYDLVNVLFRFLSFFGVADAEMPFWLGGSMNVLVPGVVLVVGAVIALAREVRRR